MRILTLLFSTLLGLILIGAQAMSQPLSYDILYEHLSTDDMTIYKTISRNKGSQQGYGFNIDVEPDISHNPFTYPFFFTGLNAGKTSTLTEARLFGAQQRYCEVTGKLLTEEDEVLTKTEDHYELNDNVYLMSFFIDVDSVQHFVPDSTTPRVFEPIVGEDCLKNREAAVHSLVCVTAWVKVHSFLMYGDPFTDNNLQKDQPVAVIDDQALVRNINNIQFLPFVTEVTSDTATSTTRFPSQRQLSSLTGVRFRRSFKKYCGDRYGNRNQTIDTGMRAHAGYQRATVVHYLEHRLNSKRHQSCMSQELREGLQDIINRYPNQAPVVLYPHGLQGSFHDAYRLSVTLRSEYDEAGENVYEWRPTRDLRSGVFAMHAEQDVDAIAKVEADVADYQQHNAEASLEEASQHAFSERVESRYNQILTTNIDDIMAFDTEIDPGDIFKMLAADRSEASLYRR